MLRQRTADWDLAADIHQDTFVIVIERLRSGQFKPPFHLAAFIRQTAVNLHISQLRKQHRRSTIGDDEWINEHVDDPTAGPIASLESNEARELVRQLVNEMRTDRDREILRRFYLSEESKHSVCKELDLDSTHFDRVLFRARQRLRQLLKTYLKIPVDNKKLPKTH